VYRLDDGLAGKVWRSGEALWSSDTRSDERSLNQGTGMLGAFVFPVVAEGRTIGVLSFNSDEVRQPDERLLQAVRAIGSQIGQFLRRKEGEEALRNYALQQRLIAEFGQQAFANTALEELLPRAARLATDTLKTDYSQVLELAPDGSLLVYKAVSGWPEDWVGSRTVAVLPGSRLEALLTHGKPRVVENYAAESDVLPSPLLQLGITSGVQVPILGSKGAYGLLGTHTREGGASGKTRSSSCAASPTFSPPRSSARTPRTGWRTSRNSTRSRACPTATCSATGWSRRSPWRSATTG
jgi:GAF domain-containing protein